MAFDALLVGAKGSSTGATVTTTAGTTVASGSTFVIALNYDAGVTLSTALNALDNKGNTYVLIGSTQSVSGAKRALYYCQNGTGGASHSASATFSGACFGTIYLIEITDAAAVSLDAAPTAATDATSPFTHATGALAQADEVVIGLIGNGEGANPMNYASSNMTVLAQEGNGAQFWSSAVAKQVVASTSSFTASFTSSGGENTHGILLATFKKNAGGGSSFSLTVDTAGLALEAQNVNFIATDALVLPVAMAQLAVEAQDVPFQLSNPGTNAQLVLEGQNVNLLAQATLIVDMAQLALEGQAIALLFVDSLPITPVDLALEGQSIVLLRSGLVVGGPGGGRAPCRVPVRPPVRPPLSRVVKAP